MTQRAETRYLLTGATGSFGRAFAALVRDERSPDRLVLFSRDEAKQHELRRQGFDGPTVQFVIGDVRDEGRLREVMRGVEVVVHAAALKHVTTCEQHPREAMLTNAWGTHNVVQAAIEAGVSKVIALSSDKAVEPAGVYGATKLLAERLLLQAHAAGTATRFASARLGNLFGSRGSVSELFRSDARTGRVQITDARMTRFWMTVPVAARFIATCVDRMSGGEVFVPKTPSLETVRMARVLAPGAEVHWIGARAGEKLHECLLAADEAPRSRALTDRYIVYPSTAAAEGAESGEPLPERFEYRSDDNTAWLSEDEVRSWAEN
ncbi:MAG: polysaccharide biosynthesis protein, partial [Planctomycetota bacterium]